MTSCIGCYERELCKSNFEERLRYTKETNNSCPCSICLIKGICIRACPEFAQFSRKSYDFKKESPMPSKNQTL
jgi:hypothetical protein